MHAQLSPDGKWIAFASDESGANEVYVQNFPDLAKGKWQISSNGGAQPRWRKDGKELFYLAVDGTIMAVPITTNADSFQAGTPRGLFQSNLRTTDPRRPEYDVFPDGQQFLVITALMSGATPMNVIVNWPSLLTLPGK
jgi:eukaryotic-like serine/threonine-protein kinase